MNGYRASRLRARFGITVATADLLALMIWGAGDE